ncbi:MAG: iron chaperone [Actinomycetota bacterium]
MEKPASVEAYLKGLTPQQRSAVQKLRETIAAAAPDAEEGITYSMPGFLLGGKGLMAYAAFSDHYSFFPMSMRAIDAHRDELGSRVTGKGTIAFEYGRPLPTALVKKIVKTRLAEAEARRARK